MKSFQHSMKIKASPAVLWEILIDVEKWGEWDKEVKFAKLNSNFLVGTKGILMSTDDIPSTFYITEVAATYEYSNFYQLPFFTKLHFTHKIEPHADYCKVIFVARFSGILSLWFYWQQKNCILDVMENALKNLSIKFNNLFFLTRHKESVKKPRSSVKFFTHFKSVMRGQLFNLLNRIFVRIFH